MEPFRVYGALYGLWVLKKTTTFFTVDLLGHGLPIFVKY